MQFQLTCDVLLPRLQQAASVVERRHTMVVLSNILFSFGDGVLSLIGSDMELQVLAQLDGDFDHDIAFTVPARKLIDLLRALPEQALLNFTISPEKLSLQTGSSRFTLATLPAEIYPAFGHDVAEVAYTLPASLLREALEKTSSFMAQQDVRFFLNGVFIEWSTDTFRCVSSDGHRMAVFEAPFNGADIPSRQCIIPRKAVAELLRLIVAGDGPITVEVSPTTACFILPALRFSTKLIEGRYPDYRRVLPVSLSHVIHIDRVNARSVLSRIAVLTSEKSRAVMLHLRGQFIHFEAHSLEQDSAADTLEAEIVGVDINLCFNVSYLLDVIALIASDKIKLSLADETATALFEDTDDARVRYVVMPLRV